MFSNTDIIHAVNYNCSAVRAPQKMGEKKILPSFTPSTNNLSIPDLCFAISHHERQTEEEWISGLGIIYLYYSS